MGQRLNIEIQKDDGVLVYANCYYHWSAYTIDTLYKVKDIIDQYRKLKTTDIKDDLLYAYKLLAIDDSTFECISREDDNGVFHPKIKTVIKCAGLSDRSFKTMNLLFPNETFVPATDRNVGLIGIHPKDIAGTREWEEGRAIININTEEFSIDVFWEFTPKENENVEDEYGYSRTALKNAKTCPELLEQMIDDGWVSFDDIDDLINIVNDCGLYAINNPDGSKTYITWIA